jgi:nucleotide-binding universal stress UspA family protein
MTPFMTKPLAGESVGKRTNTAERFLVLVDETESSNRVLDYLGRIFGKQRNVHFWLTCLLPRLPAGLLESGGADAPAAEERAEASLRLEQERWMDTLDNTTQDVLSQSVARLRQAGIRRDLVDTCPSSPQDNRSAADEVFVIAETHGCHTIVVGHTAHSWFRGVARDHLAERLVRDAKGLAIWVVD